MYMKYIIINKTNLWIQKSKKWLFLLGECKAAREWLLGYRKYSVLIWMTVYGCVCGTYVYKFIELTIKIYVL